MSRQTKRISFEDEEKGVVKPDMRQIHTGHVGKPQFATTSGPLEMQRQPQRARLQMVEQLSPRREYATVWNPPVMQYTQHYSRVENHSSDLERVVNPPELKEREEMDRMFEHLRNVRSGFIPISSHSRFRNFV